MSTTATAAAAATSAGSREASRPQTRARRPAQPCARAGRRVRRRSWRTSALTVTAVLIGLALLSATAPVAAPVTALTDTRIAAVAAVGPSVAAVGSAPVPGARPLAAPGSMPPPTPPPAPPAPADVGSCGITDLGACVAAVVNAFFENVVSDALNPLLGLLSDSLLTTPTPDSLPALTTLWNQSWQIVLACYGLLILLGGIVLMAHGTVQSRYSFKEIAPRMVVGFVAGAVSLGIAEQAVELANALSHAVLGDGLDPKTVGDTLAQLVTQPLNYNIFAQLFVLFLVGMLIALLLGWIIRICATVILIAGAPLFLMWHAVPQTEPVAYWWWRAIGACLAIQVVQSLALVTSVNVLLAPGGFEWFGPNRNGWTNDLVALALIWVLYRIPFWVLATLRRGGRQRTVVGGLARTAISVAVLRAFR